MASHASSSKSAPRKDMPPLAKIPWFKRPQPMLEVSADEHSLFQANQSDKEKMNLHRLLNQVFPYFMPKRYHTMDCKSLQEINKDGQYWTYASHFLICNQVFGLVFFTKIMEDLETKKPDFSNFRDLPFYHVNSKLLKNAETELMVEDPAEFLMEPWVLLQLSYQPILLHQWIVALLAESLRFQRELVPFYYVGYPREMQGPVKRLLSMCLEMQKCAVQFYEYFVMFAKLSQENRLNITPTMSEKMFAVYPEILPIIEFVLSSQCRRIVSSLARTAEQFGRKQKTFTKDEKFFSFFDRDQTTIYNHYCWHYYIPPLPNLLLKYTSEKPFERLKSEADILEDPLCLKGLVGFLTHCEHMETNNYDKKMTSRKLRSNRGFLKSVANKFKTYYDTSKYGRKLTDSDHGVIFDILRLNADIKMAEVRASTVCAFSSGNDSAAMKVVCADLMYENSPLISLSTISKIVGNVKNNDKWQYQEILKSTKEKIACSSPKQHHILDLCEMDAASIAAHFQERIQLVLIKMLEEQFESLQKHAYKFYPESQFVQYLLPCFVALFLELAKSVPEASKDSGVQKYVHFVDNLIRSYEESPFWKGAMGDTSLEWKISASTWLVNVCLDDANDYKMDLSTGFGSARQTSADCEQSPGLKICDALLKKGLAFVKTLKFIKTLGPEFRWQRYLSVLNTRLQLASAAESNVAKAEKCIRSLGRLCRQCLGSYQFLEDPIMKTCFQVKESLLEFADPQNRTVNGICQWKVMGIITFHLLRYLHLNEDHIKIKNLLKYYQYFPAFNLDVAEKALVFLVSKDLWSYRQLLLPLRVKDGAPEDLTLATLQFAQSNKEFYKEELELLAREEKVPMKSPGEITFFPIQHCRWCGLVDVQKFRVCPECADDPEYVDINFFCSEECEKTSLLQQHTDEHARALIIRCKLMDD